MDDIFCLFQGHIENVAVLKQQYGLNKTANEAIIVIEAYRTLRDRGPYPADQVVKDILGKFAFILYDSTSKATFVAVVSDPFCLDCSPPLSVVLVVFISDCFVSITSSLNHSNFTFLQDADGSVPFFWGTDSEGNLVLSDDVQIVQKGCGKSFAPFPKGKVLILVQSSYLRSLAIPLCFFLHG